MYLVLDLVTGGELFDRIVARGHYTEQDASGLIGQVLSAIGFGKFAFLARLMLSFLQCNVDRYLHSVGIVHRDLKPENLLYSTNDAASPKYDVIKVADFGLAKIIAGPADHSMSTTCGTPGYVAPEILEQKGYGKEVDLWSIGVILYILLCGFPPFYDDNNSLLFMAIKKADYSFPSPYWDKVSKPAIDLITRLLQPDPSKRLTIEECLKHPWISGKDEQSCENLASAQEQMKKFNAKKKLKNAINSVLAVRANCTLEFTPCLAVRNKSAIFFRVHLTMHVQVNRISRMVLTSAASK